MRYGFNISEYDVIYISYDEPNADANYADLVAKIPWAKRVHGIYGSDAAHKAAANLATTYRFITIDGDNIIDPALLNQIVVIDDNNNIDINNIVLSWPGKNIINGLIYGNGGIKCWHKQTVLEMRTHEAASADNIKSQIEFCWELTYIPIDKSFSTVHIDTSAKQAWRAGFREGVKMSLRDGLKVNSLSELETNNLDRLKTWMTIGNKSLNGPWAILGARQGCYMTMCTSWDYIQVRDFKYLDMLWNSELSMLSNYELHTKIIELGNSLSSCISLPEPFTPRQEEYISSFIKNPLRQQSNVNSYVGAYDIFMITYGETNAEENWIKLKNKFPRAQRIDMVKGIHQSHILAAQQANTPYLWIVDGDAEIVDSFNFDFIAPLGDNPAVRVWRSINPVNGLIYGYGGVKLLPRDLTRNMDVTRPDMTTSISLNYIPIMIPSNITAFNTDPFSSWRSAFRECCKLSSKIIDRQKDKETINRLHTWCTVAYDVPYARECIAGAVAGREYGEQNINNIDVLVNINNFDWLYNKFNNI